MGEPSQERQGSAEDFGKISLETGVSVRTLNTFAAISAPENAHLFTKVAAMKAFVHVQVAPCAKLPKKS